MIEPSTSVFPNNVVELVEISMSAIDPDIFVTSRPLRPTDPSQSIGVFGELWTPDEESFEMLGMAPGEPTLQQYLIGVQGFVKSADEEFGLSAHSVMSSRIRGVLYRNTNLRVALQGLSVTDETGAKETLKRWGIRTQRFLSNEIDSDWVYLSTLELWIETENRTWR